MMTLPFLDVDQNGGALFRDDKEGELFSALPASQIQVMPRSQWEQEIEGNISIEQYIQKIKGQGQEGTCVYNALAQAMEILWTRAFGPAAWIEFSPISGYYWNASGPGTGSTVGGALRHGCEVGLLPVNSDRNKRLMAAVGLNPEHTLPPGGYYEARRWFKANPTWKETAKHFRLVRDETYELVNADHFATACFYDFPIVYARARHCICGVNWVENGRSFAARYANSWTPDWGDNGYGHDSMEYIERTRAAYGAFAPRAMVYPSWDKELADYIPTA